MSDPTLSPSLAADNRELERRVRRLEVSGVRSPSGIAALDTEWHEVHLGDGAVFANGWTDYDVSWSSAAYRIDSEGWVHLKGLVKSGTLAQSVFTLPVGYRPLKHYYGTVIAGGPPAYIAVYTDGRIILDTVTGNNTWVSLDGFKFPAWQSWSDYRRYTMLGNLPSRTADTEMAPGFIVRNTGMVDVVGISGAITASGTTSHPAGDLLPYYTCQYGAMHASGNVVQTNIGATLGFWIGGTTTGYYMPATEYGLNRIEDEWLPATLLNSWTNFGSDTSNKHAPASYWRDPDGFVHLRGLIRNGSAAGATILTLPAGYRPARRCMFPSISALGTVVTRIDIEASGNVTAVSYGSTSWTSLNGICFYADA